MYSGSGLGAGPGDTVTYLVDLPLPWGSDTELTLPIQALVDDAWAAAEGKMDAAIAKGATMVVVGVAAAVLLGALWVRKR